jgi:hypothetical protein
MPESSHGGVNYSFKTRPVVLGPAAGGVKMSAKRQQLRCDMAPETRPYPWETSTTFRSMKGHLYSRGVPIQVIDYANRYGRLNIAIGSLGQFIVQLGRSIGWWQ